MQSLPTSFAESGPGAASGGGADGPTLPQAVQELADRPQWVNWKEIPREGPRPGKMPVRPNGSPASSTDAASWSSYDQVAAGAAHERVGFVLTRDDPYLCIDWDNCVSPDGEIDAAVRAELTELDTYAEYSPYGGIHAWVKGHLPTSGRPLHGVEMYDDAHFMTVTGRQVPGTPSTINSRQAQIDAVHARHVARPVSIAHAVDRPATGDQSAGDTALNRLLGGDWEAEYRSRSEADLAAVRMLAQRLGPDPALIRRVLYASALRRDKWDEPRGDSTWFEREALEPGLAPARMEDVGADRPRQFQFLTPSQVMARSRPRWLVAGLVPSNSLVLLSAPPASFKTFLALHLAMCVGTGTPFLGRECVQGAVAYVLAEGGDGLPERLAAWASHYGCSLPDRPSFLMKAPALLDGALPAFRAALSQLEPKPALVVIDTLARVMAGADENAAKDMGRFVQAIDALRADTGASVVVVHHSGKDGRGPRGSSALVGAVDTVLTIKREGHSRAFTVKVEKQKDGDDGNRIEAATLFVELPDGESSLVVIEATAPVGRSTAQGRTATAPDLGRLHQLLMERLPDTYIPLKDCVRVLGDLGIGTKSAYRRVKAMEAEGKVTTSGTGGQRGKMVRVARV